MTQGSTVLGKKIGERRRALALSQEELAELAGVSVRFVGSLEHDKPSVRLDKLIAVLEVLGLDLDVHLRRR
jgi:HTH-type transcriptional regulator/antitoxin HipB